jgi:hypothetical protein
VKGKILPILWCKAHRGNMKSDLSVGERYSATTTAHSEYFGAQIHVGPKYRNFLGACQGCAKKKSWALGSWEVGNHDLVNHDLLNYD